MGKAQARDGARRTKPCGAAIHQSTCVFHLFMRGKERNLALFLLVDCTSKAPPKSAEASSVRQKRVIRFLDLPSRDSQELLTASTPQSLAKPQLAILKKPCSCTFSTLVYWFTCAFCLLLTYCFPRFLCAFSIILRS